MATATVKWTVTKVPGAFGSNDQGTVTYFGSVAFSAAADTYATGGLAALAGFDLKNLGPYSDRTPLTAYVFSTVGSGWNYQFNLTSRKLMILAGGGSGTAAPIELTNATALNAATPNIFTDVVAFALAFPRI
jgi:hypothetical protein